MGEETRQEEIMLTNLFIFVLATWGMTSILVYGRIFNAIRPKNKFFHCPQCVGFYVGVAVFLFMWFFGASFVANLWVGLATGPFIASAVSYFMTMVVDDDGIRSHKKLTLKGETRNVKLPKSSNKKVDE